MPTSKQDKKEKSTLKRTRVMRKKTRLRKGGRRRKHINKENSYSTGYTIYYWQIPPGPQTRSGYQTGGCVIAAIDGDKGDATAREGASEDEEMPRVGCGWARQLVACIATLARGLRPHATPIGGETAGGGDGFGWGKRTADPASNGYIL